MNSDLLPVTISTEYKDVSLLLSALTHGVTASTSFYILALDAFGLSYSATPKEVETLFEGLQEQILAINAQSELIAEDTEAVGFAVHILTRHGKWNRELRSHQENLVSYFERVETSQWLRSPAVATSFLLGFVTKEPFRFLVSKAKAYLAQKLREPADGNFPVVLFGLYLAGDTPQVSDMQVTGWLNRTHQPFKHLCMLAVTLDALHHPLSTKVIACLRDRVLEIYATTVDPNINTIRILLAIIHMAEMGQSADQITYALRHFPVDDNVRNRVSAVIRADSLLFVEFRDDLLAQTPTIDFLAFYLFAASQLGLIEAYIVADPLKTRFIEFMNVWRDKRVKAVHQTALRMLILISFAASITAVFKIWWPLSNSLYDLVMEIVPWQLAESYLDDFLKWLIALPVYFAFGSALALWLQGKVGWSDIGPEGVIKNTHTMIKQSLGQRE